MKAKTQQNPRNGESPLGTVVEGALGSPPDLARAGVVHIENSRGKVDFYYPDTVYMKNLVVGVLKGRAYPIVNLPGYRPEVILDVGANVGAAAVYFKLQYPDARLFCYEPSPHNYVYLERNLGRQNGVKLYPYGLYNRDKTTTLFGGADIPAQDSIVQSTETGRPLGQIQLVGAAGEIARLGLTRISILKVDTEGCEIPILADLLPQLDGVDILYLEYHSERDRLAMDRLLCPQYLLLHARADSIHRGTVLYIDKALAAHFRLDRMAIARPA